MEEWAIGQGILSANFLGKESGNPKPVAYYAISDSSGNDCPGIHLGAGKEKHAVANMALSSTIARLGGLVARMDEDEALKPPGSDTVMPAWFLSWEDLLGPFTWNGLLQDWDSEQVQEQGVS